MGTPDCSSVLRRNVASMALQASLAFSSPTSPSLLSLRVARSLLAATPSPTPLPSPGQIRFKRVNIQKPRRPDWFRQQLLAVAAPRYSPPQTIEELPDSCEMAEKEEERREWKEHINQLEKFYVQEMVEMFEKSEMIAFFHTNPIKEADWRKAWQNGRRAGMELQRFQRRVGVAGLRGTKWENCLHFFMNFPGEHTQPILFSPKTDPKKLLAYERKVPEFQLLAAVIHGRILSKAGVQELVTTPDLATQRAELSALLTFNQRKTLSLLGANQQTLSTNLDQYVKDKTV